MAGLVGQAGLLDAIDEDIATGVWPDMTEHGWERDGWPAIFERVMAAREALDFFLLGTGETMLRPPKAVRALFERHHIGGTAAQKATLDSLTNEHGIEVAVFRDHNENRVKGMRLSLDQPPARWSKS